jgi:DNA-binding NtrC family response regulator
VLVIEDDAIIRSNVLELLEAEGFDTDQAADGKAGVAAALAHVPDVIVCDIMMPVMDGHQVLRAVRDYPETAAIPFIFLTAKAQREDVRAGMSLGADDYLTKPFTRHELLDAIQSRIERTSVITMAVAPREEKPSEPRTDAVVRSKTLRDVYERAFRSAQSHLNVLLLGETGVGKDVLAHAIHKASPRADKPFIPLNCAALAENLLESELFGYEKGAFTGAQAAQMGLFEAADGGTVFLDEVGDLPLPIQAKLLRVLEDRRVLRVGARVFRDIDVRFIAATNRELEADADKGTFRRDLYFRIANIVLTVPPLRERKEDVAPLAERFLHNVCRQLGRSPVPRIADDAMRALEGYRWPGNVRELRNVIEQCVALLDSGVVSAAELPARVREGAAQPVDATRADLEARMREHEKKRIIDALDACGGNQTRAADMLGMSRRTLLHRLDELDLPRPRKR